jgi:DNA-binding XRE family transcriptional regulator
MKTISRPETAGTDAGLSHSSGTLRPGNVPRPTLVRVPALLYYRLKLGLTQKQLAERSGIGRPTIARLENNAETRISTVAKLAVALGVKPDDLRRQPPED